jgi:hypothetical protein
MSYECGICYWYWENNLTENECCGGETPCDLFLDTLKGDAYVQSELERRKKNNIINGG